MVVLVLFAFGTMVGCGGGGSTAAVSSGGNDTGGDTGDTNPYSGDATVSGSIDVSSLSSSDTALLARHLPKGASGSGKLFKQRLAKSYIEDAVVKLYVIGEDGSLEDTDITGTLSLDENGDPVYAFSGVADGVSYVVRYVKLVGDGQALELKANAYVPAGATEPEGGSVSVSPKTTVVMETLVNAILDATNGTGISQAIVNSIIAAVKAAIEALVDSGLIQIPSMVVEATGTTIDEIAASQLTNDDVANAAGMLLSDSSVDTELGAMKSTTLAARFDINSVSTDVEKGALIVRVFDEMLNDGSAPGFMVEFLTDVYVAGTTKTIGQMVDAIAAGLQFRSDVPTPDISKSAAIAAFKQKLTDINTLLDHQTAGTLSDSEKSQLAGVPPVIMGLFPIANRTTWENLTTSTTLNVPQAIAMTIYVVDVYISEAFSDLQSTITATAADGAGVSYNKEEPFNFDPMVPGSIMDALGFYQVYQNYAGIDIFDLWIHPGRAWIESSPGQGTEVEMLSAGTCLSDVAQMVAQFNPNLGGQTAADLTAATVTLSYPKSNGTTGTVDLVSEASLMQGGPGGPGGFGESCYILDPFREAMAGQDPNAGPQNGPMQPDTTRIVSDFGSGTYTVTVVLDGQTVTKSFVKKVITGMTKATPTLVTPHGFPNWPGNGASQAELDAFNVAMQAFNESGTTVFSANVDTDDDGVNDVAKVTVSWNAPTVTLPAGVKMGYNMDLGKGGCDQNGCTWDPIFNTWDHNKTLFTTSFTIPVNLVKDTTPYQLNVGIVFLDATTGEMLGQGGNAHAEFLVSDPLDTTQTFTIHGTAVDGYKVVLVREVENKDSLTNRFTRTSVEEVDVVDGAYDLTPTIGDFVDTLYRGAWYNIIMFSDSDGTPGFSNGDQQYWPGPDGLHVWFNTFGGMLRVGSDSCAGGDPANGIPGTCTHSETLITGGETVSGPTYSLTIP
jgi:hypothetical protein